MPRKKKTVESQEGQNPLLALVEDVCQQMNLEPTSLDPLRPDGRIGVVGALSTGSLTLDLILGGGYPSGMRTNLFGKEHGGKSTLCYLACRQALAKNIPVIFFDYEGATSADRVKRLGLRLDDPNWRYFQKLSTGEVFFRFAKRLLDQMPDPTGADPQLVLVVDSIPAMLPEAIDAYDTTSASAVRARMFSDMMPMIKSRVRAKNVLWLDTNQLRLNPRARFGNPEYEPGGSAVHHYSDVRVKVTPISSPRAKKKIEDEPCWDGRGYDRYTYAKVLVTKHKAFSPHREAHIRIWFEHRGAPGFGVDPVFDVFKFLELTGQLEYSRGRFKIAIPPYDKKTWTWKTFKAEVLRPVFTDNKEHELVQICRQQLADDVAYRLMFATQSGIGEDDDNTPEVDDESVTDEPVFDGV